MSILDWRLEDARVVAGIDFLNATTGVWMYVVRDRERLPVLPAELIIATEPVAPGSYVPPTLSLPHTMGRRLGDALLAAGGPALEPSTLREDLLHERGRVDKFIDAMIEQRRRR